jgi:hypothetical protein
MRHKLLSVAVWILLSVVTLCSQDLTQDSPPASPATAEGSSKSDIVNDNVDSGLIRVWTHTAEKAKASQPHFVAPFVTTHVMLVQQFRYDMYWQADPGGGTTTSNYGGSRGLEIIPSSRLEVAIFPPSYVAHETNTPNGFSDLSYLMKFRAFSRAEGKGDYFVGFFFGGSLPTARTPNGLGHAVLSPTFAAAKGLGPWDVQSTIGATLPIGGTDVLGRALLFNTAVDYRIKGMIWPMIEQNSTFWLDGPLHGDKQVFLTPGVVAGPFALTEKLHVGFGFGVQIAATSFHQYNYRRIFSLRFPF